MENENLNQNQSLESVQPVAQSAVPTPQPVETPVVNPTPVMEQPTVAPAPVVNSTPVVEQPTVAPAPVVNPTPVVEQPTVAPTPVVNPTPVVEQPTVAPAPVVNPTPVVEQPTVAPTPVLEQPIISEPIVSTNAEVQQTVPSSTVDLNQPLDGSQSTGEIAGPDSKKKKSKSNPVLIVVLLLGIAFLGYYIYTNYLTTTTTKSSTSSTQTTQTTEETTSTEEKNTEIAIYPDLAGYESATANTLINLMDYSLPTTAFVADVNGVNLLADQDFKIAFAFNYGYQTNPTLYETVSTGIYSIKLTDFKSIYYGLYLDDIDVDTMEMTTDNAGTYYINQAAGTMTAPINTIATKSLLNNCSIESTSATCDAYDTNGNTVATYVVSFTRELNDNLYLVNMQLNAVTTSAVEESSENIILEEETTGTQTTQTTQTSTTTN